MYDLHRYVALASVKAPANGEVPDVYEAQRIFRSHDEEIRSLLADRLREKQAEKAGQ